MENQRNQFNEYSVAADNVRHQDTIIFANMTVFATITGGLIAFIFNSNPVITGWLRIVAETAGGLTGLAFWINAEIYFYRFHHFLKRLADLDPELGFRQYCTIREIARPKFRPGMWAWRILFFAVTLFWVARAVIDAQG
ncbi:MAG: hypothetical protein HZA46_07355 [Planctomycetales bacterium]|nr:hypothetical protein [Planctomycetales bacterium]